MKWLWPLRRLFVREAPTLSWRVQFEEGGPTDIYHRTEERFWQEMREQRFVFRGKSPHRVQVVRGGRLVEVRLNAE